MQPHLGAWHKRTVLIGESAGRACEAALPNDAVHAEVEGRCILIGVLDVLRSGLRWQDRLSVHKEHKTLHDRFMRPLRPVVFARIFRNLV